MKFLRGIACAAALLAVSAGVPLQAAQPERHVIAVIDPPQKGFFSKELSFEGIPIKAHAVVSDEAMYAAHDRLALMLRHLPVVVTNLIAGSVELPLVSGH